MTENKKQEILDIKFQQRFVPNLVSNIISFIFSLVIGFALVPYFVNTLGYAAYGLIPLATSITSYVTMVIDALNIPVSRYISISLQRGNQSDANTTYSTVLIGTLTVILALIPLSILIACISPYIFNIGDSSETDVAYLFLFVIGSVLIRAWSSNFMATLFAYNRLDLRNYVNIINQVVQVVLIVFFFSLVTPSLTLVGLSYFAGAICALVVAIFFSKRTVSRLVFSLKYYSRRLFLEITKVAGWSLIDYLGCVLNSTIALIAANIILGDVVTSDYSIANVIYVCLISLGGLITTLFTPKVYTYVSSNDISGMVQFCKSAIKCSAIMMSLIIALVCIFTPQILTFWMGDKYLYLTPLIWGVIVPSIVWVTVSPVSSLGIALLKPRVPALSAVFTGSLNILLICVFTFGFNMSVYGIVFATIISAVLHAWVICPIYYAHITQVPWYSYVFPMYKSLIYLALILCVGGGIVSIFPVTSIWSSIPIGVLVILLYILIIPRIVLKSFEKDMIRSIIPKAIGKFIPSWIL